MLTFLREDAEGRRLGWNGEIKITSQSEKKPQVTG